MCAFSLQDYFVLIPEAYYEATVLTKLVDKPCGIGERNLCRHFAYPSLRGLPTANITTLITPVTEYVNNPEVTNICIVINITMFSLNL